MYSCVLCTPRFVPARDHRFFIGDSTRLVETLRQGHTIGRRFGSALELLWLTSVSQLTSARSPFVSRPMESRNCSVGHVLIL